MAKKGPKSPGSVAVTIGGKRRRLRYCGASVKLAAQQGVDLADLVPPDSAEEDTATGIDLTFKLLWFGRLAFEPDLTQEDVEMEILIPEIKEAGEAAVKAFKRYMPGVDIQVTENGEAVKDEKKEQAQAAE